jgi:N-acetyl-anhydromuramyl-L-alanine amidase AmpD
MLGIAVSGDTSKRGLTEREVDSVVEWCMTMMREYNIPIGNVTTHRAVSPGRKTDVSPQAEAVLMEALTKRLSSVARPTVVMASAKRVERK